MEEFDKFLKKNRIGKSEIARYLGVSPSFITHILKGEDKLPATALKKICENDENRDISMLLSGEGSPYSEEIAEPRPQGIPLVPVSAMAGALTGDIPGFTLAQCARFMLPSISADFLMTVSGDSMEPRYLSGDIVACKRVSNPTFIQWHKVYVVDSEQGPLIKRLEKSEDDSKISFVSENAEYEPFELDRSEVRSIALVVGLIRNV